MSALRFLVPSLAAAVLVTGCGGGSRHADAGDSSTAGDEAMTSTEDVVQLDPNAESEIPGVTNAELALQPPVPPLQTEPITLETTPEDIAGWIRAEARLHDIDGLSIEAREAFVRHHWLPQIEHLQHELWLDLESEVVPGITNRQVRDMIPAPAMPSLFGRGHTVEDLRAHAVIVAREEADLGTLDVPLDARVTYITYIWEGSLRERQAMLADVDAHRAARSTLALREAEAEGRWRRGMVEQLTITERELLIERFRTAPVLSPDEEALLQAILWYQEHQSEH